MKKFAKKIYLAFSILRLIPHLLIFTFHPVRTVIEKDIERWSKELGLNQKHKSRWEFLWNLSELLTFWKEFRNLFYYRLGWGTRILYPICPPEKSLFINKCTDGIGPGFMIMHGRGSGISCERIGRNFTVFHHSVIGYTGAGKRPTLGDNVTVCAGAKVLGKIYIGDNVVIGANAVVTKDVPANCTVVGVYPTFIIRKNGERVEERL